MAQSVRMLSNSPPWLERLLDTFQQDREWFARVADEVIETRLPDEYHDIYDAYDRNKADVYFCLYTIPVLEAANTFGKWDEPTACMWGRIQLCLGMHIRYMDLLLDGDPAHISRLEIVRRSRIYIHQAQRLLSDAGASWSDQHEARYSQYIDYEIEIEAGNAPHYETLWRRVSPLTLVPDFYLQTADHFQADFKRYLAWSLLRGDSMDIISDIGRSHVTPATAIAKELAGPNRKMTAQHVGAAEREVREFLKRTTPLAEKRTLWKSVIEMLSRDYEGA